MATISVLPAKLNYKITRGDDFADVVTIKEGVPPVPVDVSGRTFTADLRVTANTVDPPVAEFVIDMTNAVSGEVGYSLPDSVTEDLAGNYVWDFQQESPGGVIRTLMGGSFSVAPDVTRA